MVEQVKDDEYKDKSRKIYNLNKDILTLLHLSCLSWRQSARGSPVLAKRVWIVSTTGNTD